MAGHKGHTGQLAVDTTGGDSISEDNAIEVSSRLDGGEVVYTKHALRRRDSRRISSEAVQKAIEIGRVIFTRGLTVYVIGRKEVEKSKKHGIDISKYEGVQVLCSPDGVIVTVYRNRDFRRLRFRGPRWSH